MRIILSKSRHLSWTNNQCIKELNFGKLMYIGHRILYIYKKRILELVNFILKLVKRYMAIPETEALILSNLGLRF